MNTKLNSGVLEKVPISELKKGIEHYGKQEFKNKIIEILEKGGDTKNSIEEINNINSLLSKNSIYGLINYSLSEAKENYTFANQVLSSILKNFDIENEFLDKRFDFFVGRIEYKKGPNEIDNTIKYILPNIISKGNLSEEKLNILFDKVIEITKRLDKENDVLFSYDGIVYKLLETGKITSDKLNILFEEITKLDIKSFYNIKRFTCNLIEKGNIDETKLDLFFNNLLLNLNEDNLYFSFILGSVIDNGKVSDDKINMLFDNFTKEIFTKNSRLNYLFPYLIRSGKVSNYKINKLFDEVIENEQIDEDNFDDIIAVLIKSGKLSKSKINNLFDEFVKKSETNTKYLITFLPKLIKSGKITQDRLNNFSKYSINRFKNRTENDINKKNFYFELFTFSSLIDIGKVNKKDLNEVFEYGVSQLESNNEYLKVIMGLIDSGKISSKRLNNFSKFCVSKVKNRLKDDEYFYLEKFIIPQMVNIGKVSDSELSEIWEYCIEQSENNNYYFEVLISLEKTGKISSNKINILFNNLLEKAKNNKLLNDNILSDLIDTGKVNKQKLNSIWDYVIIKSENNFNLWKITLASLIRKLEFSALEKSKIKDEYRLKEIYKRNFELLGKVQSEFKNKPSFYTYLNSIFFDLDKLEKVSTVLEYFNKTTLSINNVNELINILKISETKPLEFAFFKTIIKHYDGEIENISVTKDNFINYMDDGETLFEFGEDTEDNTFPKPWTKEWFLEDMKRVKYLKGSLLSIFEKFGNKIGFGTIDSQVDVLRGKHLSSTKHYIKTGIYNSPGIKGLKNQKDEDDFKEKVEKSDHIDYYLKDSKNTENVMSFSACEERHSIVISKLNKNRKHSIDYFNCTAIVAIGKDKITGENISILTHNDPTFFLSDEYSTTFREETKKEVFIKALESSLKELKERSEEGSVDILILGGNNNYNFQQFNDGISLMNSVIYKIFNFTASIVGGATVNLDVDNSLIVNNKDILVDTENRRVFLFKRFEDGNENENFTIMSKNEVN